MKGQWMQMKGGKLSHYFIARDKVTGDRLSVCDLKVKEKELTRPERQQCRRCKAGSSARLAA